VSKLNVLKLGVHSKINACHVLHVTFSFAFSSSYAKTWTVNLCMVVQQHTEGMVGSIRWTMCANLLLFPAVQEFWKSVKNWQSYCHEFGVLLFLGHGVYNVYQQKSNCTTEIKTVLHNTCHKVILSCCQLSPQSSCHRLDKENIKGLVRPRAVT